MRREGTIVGIFPSAWEAELARRYLDEAGIAAWLDDAVPGSPGHLGEARPVRLYVAPGDEEEARLILEDPDPLDLDDDLAAARAAQRRRPLWVAAVALLVVAGMVITAVPRILWVPLLALAFFGVILWQLVRPAPRR